MTANDSSVFQARFMRRRWAEIRALEAELGEDHTQVTGVTRVRGEAARERHGP